MARDLDPAWGRQVVADLRRRLGRDPNPAEVVREAARRAGRGRGQTDLFEPSERDHREREG